MTTGQKWFSLLLLQAGLLGAAYVGGRYPEWKKLQLAEENLRKVQNDGRQAMLVTRARAVLMEAALAARYGNYGMAFERVIRAQTAAQSLKLPLQKEFDELSALLIAQKPEVLEKILLLADKIEPPARLVPPELMPGSTGTSGSALLPPPAPASGPTAGTSTPPAARTSTGPAASEAAPPAAAAAGAASSRPVPALAPAIATPAAAASATVSAPAVPPRNAQPEVTLEQSRASLLAAKELLIGGSEPGQVIPKIAHAQVLLEEGGHPEFAEQFSTAIKALRAHDEQKARTALDSVLTSLRSL
mgnify:CR=1 FL=1